MNKPLLMQTELVRARSHKAHRIYLGLGTGFLLILISLMLSAVEIAISYLICILGMVFCFVMYAILRKVQRFTMQVRRNDKGELFLTIFRGHNVVFNQAFPFRYAFFCSRILVKSPDDAYYIYNRHFVILSERKQAVLHVMEETRDDNGLEFWEEKKHSRGLADDDSNYQAGTIYNHDLERLRLLISGLEGMQKGS